MNLVKAFAFSSGSFDAPLRPNVAGAGWELMVYREGGWEKESVACPVGLQGTELEAEYRAAILAVRRASRLGVTHMVLRTDSKLLADHMNGHVRLRDEGLRPPWRELQRLRAEFENLNFEHVSREVNRNAIRLAHWAAERANA